MVQGRTVTIICLLAYCIISVGVLFYANSFWTLTVGEWIALITLMVFAGVFVLEGLNLILKQVDKPKIKIEGARVEIHNEGTEGAFKDLYFDIWNEGGQQASDSKVKVKVKGVWVDLLASFPMDLYPDDKKSVHLCQVIKSDEKVKIGGRSDSSLDRGQAYTLDMRFYGRNFKDRKSHRLKLDLSSWENIGIILDC